MRPAVFLRFCKDCQIVSKRMPGTAVELEVARFLKTKENVAVETVGVMITFADFLCLLDLFAAKIHSKDHSEIAVKRLLLENVLVLANRRVPSMEVYDLDDTAANHVLKETYGKCLMNIFHYYLDRAEKRRNAIVAAEKMRHKDLRALTNAETSRLQERKTAVLTQLQETVKGQRDVISYKEYMQFCYDFNLKSTSLLTAVQVGEIFLNLAPLHVDGPREAGLTSELFLRALTYMSFVAYRDLPASVTAENKIKALLLYMWKAVNDSDRTQRLVRNNRSHTLTHFAGSLNLFGSGLFSDTFLAHWMHDQFVDYASPKNEQKDASSSVMISNVISKETLAQADGSILAVEDHHSVLGAVQKSLVLDAKPSAPRPQRRTNSIYIKPFSATVQTRSATSDHRRAMYANHSSAGILVPAEGILHLKGQNLSILLQNRPELAEFLCIEIQNMKAEKVHKR
eukprot:scaffold1365_cov163-Ochromonas_danica.AAC.33